MSGVWRFPLDRLFISGDFPSELICLHDEMIVDAETLIGSTIWMLAIIPGSKDQVYAHVAVDSVCVIKEGINEGHYLLALNPLRSFRILPVGMQDRGIWLIESHSVEIGITPCDDSFCERILTLLRENTTISYSPPNVSEGFNFDDMEDTDNSRVRARELFSAVLSKYKWGDLNKWGSYKNASPLCAAAINLVNKHYAVKEIVSHLLEYDRQLLSALYEERHVEATLPTHHRNDFGADTVMVEITPDTIVARTFVNRPGKPGGSLHMGKTEQAESRHQEILRDVSRFLIDSGITPYQTRSVDLACKVKGGIILSEIKSANILNYESQVEKGLYQLLKYELSFEDEGFTIYQKLLIVERIDNNGLSEYASRIIKKAGVGILHYDDRIPWPNRLPSLLQLIQYSQTL